MQMAINYLNSSHIILETRIYEIDLYGFQGRTGMYTLVVPSLSTKFIKNSHQNLPV